jgi:hypothetical protein
MVMTEEDGPMSSPAPALVPLARPRKLNFPRKQPSYLRLLCDAASHPDAPASDRKQLTLFAQREAKRETPVDTTGSVVSETRWCMEPYCGAPATATLACAFSGESVAAQLHQAAEVSP